MMNEIPQLKDKVEIEYRDILAMEEIEEENQLNPPVVMINGTIFSEGHVPIIKKLSSQLFKMIN